MSSPEFATHTEPSPSITPRGWRPPGSARRRPARSTGRCASPWRRRCWSPTRSSLRRCPSACRRPRSGAPTTAGEARSMRLTVPSWMLATHTSWRPSAMPSGWAPTSIVPPGTGPRRASRSAGCGPAWPTRATRRPWRRPRRRDRRRPRSGRPRPPALLVDARERVVLCVGDPHRARVVDGDAVGAAADGDEPRRGAGRRPSRARAPALASAVVAAGLVDGRRLGGRGRRRSGRVTASRRRRRRARPAPARTAATSAGRHGQRRGSSGARSASRATCRRRRRAGRGLASGKRAAGGGAAARDAAAPAAAAPGARRVAASGVARPRRARARGAAQLARRSRSARRGPWPAPGDHRVERRRDAARARRRAGASSWRCAYIVATSESRTKGGRPVRQWKRTQPSA